MTPPTPPTTSTSAPTTTGAGTAIPPVLRAAVVARPLAEAWAVFTDEIGAWWPLPTHSVFGADAGGVHFVDGRLVERAVDGRETTWAEVEAWEPPHRLVLAWHPGADPGPCGRVELRFTADGAGTRVELRHDGWESFGEDALRRRRGYTGPSAWGHVLDHFADAAESRDDAPDLDALAAAYAEFFDEAARGGFGPAADGGWTAEEVVAHVALNDLAMTAVAHALVHGDPIQFANRTCQRPDVLAAVVAAAGDLDVLVALGRRCAKQALGAVRRLSAEQRATAVPCCLEHDGDVVLDEGVPWGRLAIDVQASRHLPAHVDQLRSLRA